jgi:hypothetical protein
MRVYDGRRASDKERSYTCKCEQEQKAGMKTAFSFSKDSKWLIAIHLLP